MEEITKLQISQSSGWSGEIEVCLQSCTVQQLKEQIEVFSGVPCPQQKLICAGRILQNEKTLSDQKVKPNAKIILTRTSSTGTTPAPVLPTSLSTLPVLSTLSNPSIPVKNDPMEEDLVGKDEVQRKATIDNIKKQRENEAAEKARIKRQIEEDRNFYRARTSSNISANPVPAKNDPMEEDSVGQDEVQRKATIENLKKQKENVIAEKARIKRQIEEDRTFYRARTSSHSAKPDPIISTGNDDPMEEDSADLVEKQRKITLDNIKKQKENEFAEKARIKRQIEEDRNFYRARTSHPRSEIVIEQNIQPISNISKPLDLSQSPTIFFSCRSANGNFSIQLEKSSTLHELKKEIHDHSYIPFNLIQINFGYPPKEIIGDDQPLSSFFQFSHEILSIETKVPTVAPIVNTVIYFPDPNVQLPFVPEEVWSLIWNLLKLSDLARCAQVCKDWNNAVWKNRKCINYDSSSNESNSKMDDKVLHFIGNWCQQLDTLTICGSKITDSGLRYLKTQTKLRTLGLSLLPQLSDKAFAFIGSLTSLETLQVEHSVGVTSHSMRHLTALTKLSHLTFGGVSTSGIGLKYVAHLSNLKTLHWYPAIEESLIEDEHIIPLNTISQLIDLDFRCNGFTETGFALLPIYFPSLQILNLSISSISDKGMEDLCLFSNLNSLKISSCGLNDNSFSFCSNLGTLQELKVSWNQELTDSAVMNTICKLAYLQVLDLSHCTNLTVESFKLLTQKLLHLHTLSIQSIATDDIVQCIGSDLHSLKHLSLDHSTNLTSLRSLTPLPHLESLTLEGCSQISNTNRGFLVLSNLQSAQTLKLLNLSRCALNDNSLVTIGTKLPSLENIQIAETGISDAAIHALCANSFSLREVNVKDCPNISVSAITLLTSMKIKVLQNIIDWKTVFTLKN